MTNFGSKILNNAISGLRAQQAVIATSGNNIANVNTPGYSRRLAQLQTRTSGTERSGIQVGNGVEIASIRRQADLYIEKVLRDAIGDKSSSQIQSEFMGRIEDLFNLTGTHTTIGSALTNFFSAVNDLSANPASIELRTNMLERGQDLVGSIRQTFNTLAGLQDEADHRISDEITTVNTLTSQIADLNGRITAREAAGGGVEAAEERDTRENLLNQLAEKISFERVELPDGSVTISLPGGFPVVVGATSRSLDVTKAPSFSSGNLPPSLSGGVLSYLVYDYDTGAGTAHIDLTQQLQNGNGTIAGLLALRGYADASNTTPFEASGVITQVASRVEGITRALLTTFNQSYLGPDRDGSTVFHNPSAGDLNGNTPAVFGFFDFNYSGAKDRLVADGLPTTADLDDITSVAGVGNYSSILQLAFSDPARIAAGLDTSGNTSGALQIAAGDGRNIKTLADLRSATFTLAAGGSGTFSLNATLDDGYGELVGYVGARSARADGDLAIANENYLAASSRRDEVSGVSLDEEFTKLIQSQKAYQASARMIKIADDLLSQLLQLI